MSPPVPSSIWEYLNRGVPLATLAGVAWSLIVLFTGGLQPQTIADQKCTKFSSTHNRETDV